MERPGAHTEVPCPFLSSFSPQAKVTVGGSLHFPPASGVWLGSPAWAPQGLPQTLANSSLPPQGAEADRPGGVHPYRNLHLPGTYTQGTFVRQAGARGRVVIVNTRTDMG